MVPKPLQKPHPPLWVACSQLDTIKYAAHRGMGALSFKFVDLAAARAWVNAYYNTFIHNQEKLCDYEANPNIAVVAGFMCAETDEQAWRQADGSRSWNRRIVDQVIPAQPGAQEQPRRHLLEPGTFRPGGNARIHGAA